MYEGFDMGTMRLDVTIPAQKLLAQASLLVEQYKPIVEEALKEAMFEMTDNNELREALKERIKSKLRQKISEELDKKADAAIKQALNNSQWKFYDVVDDALKELMEKNL